MVSTIILDALIWSVMLIVMALGLTIIFGFMEVVNFAHGAFYMAGGYVVYAATSILGLNFFVGVGLAIVVVGFLGLLTEVALLRPSYDSGPITQVLILIGLSFVFEAAALELFEGDLLGINPPEALAGSMDILGFNYPIYRFAVFVFGVVLILLTWIWFKYSSVGLVVRMSLTDRTMAQALGNDIPRIYTGVFVGGVALAGLAGALLVPMRGISPQSGTNVLLTIFIVVVVGGLGSFRGTVLAGLLIGSIDILVARYIAFRMSGLTVLIILVLVLTIRPRGLFGEAGVFEE
jgi:branched-subunit amino acid ABC-type transport system permease component